MVREFSQLPLRKISLPLIQLVDFEVHEKDLEYTFVESTHRKYYETLIILEEAQDNKPLFLSSSLSEKDLCILDLTCLIFQNKLYHSKVIFSRILCLQLEIPSLDDDD